MRILITGGTGFVGRHVVPIIKRKFPNAQIYCTLRPSGSLLETTGRQILKQLKIKNLRTDLSDWESVAKLPRNFDYVIHLAASAETSERDHSFNELSMRLLLRHLNLTTIKHFIFTSTTAVWSGRTNFNHLINETLPPIPSNEYGRSKIKAEQLLLQESRLQSIPVTIFRLSTVYGSGTRHNGLFDALKKMIPKHSFISRLNWPGLTSLIYVNDVAQLLVLSLKQKPKHNQNLYIVYSQSLTLSDISRLLHQALGLPYQPIRLSTRVWKLAGLISRCFFLLEFLPAPVYNFFWRSTLIINPTLACHSDKLKKDFPSWKTSMFEQKVEEVIR